MNHLPTGTVTFLFTDIEGSTRLLRELGEGYQQIHDDHARILREAIRRGGGTEIRTEGDSYAAIRCASGRGKRPGENAMRAIAVLGWLVIIGALLVWQGVGLVRGPEWPTLSDFFRGFMRPAAGRFILLGLWLWLGWHLFIRGWQFFLRG